MTPKQIIWALYIYVGAIVLLDLFVVWIYISERWRMKR